MCSKACPITNQWIMDYQIIDESCQVIANNQIVGVVRLCMVTKQLNLVSKNNCSLTSAKWSLACC